MAEILFDDVVACTWRMKLALRCEQLEVEKLSKKELEAAPAISLGEEPADPELEYPGAMEFRRRMKVLDELRTVCGNGRSIPANLQRSVIEMLGPKFWQLLTEWAPKNYVAMMLANMTYEKRKLLHMEDMESSLPVPSPDELQQFADRDAVGRKDMQLKLIAIRKDFEETLDRRARVSSSRDAAQTHPSERLDLFLRYGTTARRDFYRALAVFQAVNK